jgi:uncharacterized membrane protein
MPNIHPLLVHFPIALLSIAFLFDVFGFLLKKGEIMRFGWLNQLVGTLMLGAAIISGLYAKESVSVQEVARNTLEIHEQMAFLAAVLFSVLLFWRFVSRKAIPNRLPWVFLALNLVAVVVMWAGAWLGGELVYVHGVGVSR